jgi:hypothetical protein
LKSRRDLIVFWRCRAGRIEAEEGLTELRQIALRQIKEGQTEAEMDQTEAEMV